MPDGVLAWIANWATTLSTRLDTMEIARTGNRQLEHEVAFFFLKRDGELCVCACICVHLCACTSVGWGICITDAYHAGWCETVSSRGAQGEMQCPCWETLQSYLPSCLPLRLRPSLSTSLFPLSECTPIFLPHHFSALFAHPSSHPALHTHSQSLLYLFPSSSANGESIWCLYFYWVHWLCVLPINSCWKQWQLHTITSKCIHLAVGLLHISHSEFGNWASPW